MPAGTVGDWMSSAIRSVTDALSDAWQATGSAISNLVASVVSVSQKITKAITELANKVFELVGDGLQALGQAIGKAAKFIGSMLCDAFAGFMDTVVKNIIRGFLEVATFIVYNAGKFVAKALLNSFNIKRIEYTGSLQELVAGNLGTFKVDATIPLRQHTSYGNTLVMATRWLLQHIGYGSILVMATY